MRAVSDRIRWTDNGMGGFDGHVGTSKRLAFELWQAPAGPGNPGDWVITSELPLPDASRPGYTYAFSGKDPDELRARAERRLEEFISSLGAVFPEPAHPAETYVPPGVPCSFDSFEVHTKAECAARGCGQCAGDPDAISIFTEKE
jgi:hypothetical protein